MLSELGLIVAREIPVRLLGGVLSGSLSVHGGVIRDAGGRIVAHLAMGSGGSLSSLVPGLNILSSIIEQGQLWQLGRDVAKVQEAVSTVLSVSMAGTVVSGLGLVSTLAGVVYLSRKLDRVEAQLATIERDVKALKKWSESLQRAELRQAIGSLKHAATAVDPENRREALWSCKRDFGVLSSHYAEVWSSAAGIAQVTAMGELATVSMLGHAAACSDLGLTEGAASDLHDSAAAWTSAARRHVNGLIGGSAPARLLGADCVERLPIRTLTGLLDFAYDSDRGIDWVDDLRRKPTSDSLLSEIFTRSSQAPAIEAVDLARGLRAKADVLDAAVAHYDFLDHHKLGVTAFQAQLDAARNESGAEAICVYASD